MLVKRKLIIVLTLACSLAFLQLAGAADVVNSNEKEANIGGGTITRIQAVPSVIVIDNTEYSLPQDNPVYGPDRQPIDMDTLDVGMEIRFTIQQPSTPGGRPIITSIRISTN